MSRSSMSSAGRHPLFSKGAHAMQEAISNQQEVRPTSVGSRNDRALGTGEPRRVPSVSVGQYAESKDRGSDHRCPGLICVDQDGRRRLHALSSCHSDVSSAYRRASRVAVN